MKVTLILLCAVSVFAEVYKAQIEPYEKISISAEVSGRIIELDQKDELKMLDKKVLVIDHNLESHELANAKEKLALLKDQIVLKQGQYDRIKDLQGQSLNTKERYKSELLILQIQVTDLKNTIEKLDDLISKKEITLHNVYLKNLYVTKDSFVSPGTKLMDIEDQSGSRIVLYVNKEDRDNLTNGTILINDNADHGYGVEKVGNSTDAKYLSSYRVELVKKGEASFGEIVNVEIKDKI